MVIVPKGSTDLSLFLTGVSPVCSYEITYISTSASIVTVIQNTLYSFELTSGKRTYFLYSHTANEDFKVVRLLSTGSTKISIAPIDSADSTL